MDELLQHCLQELAFDGDLGCNVTRLRDFVHEFYSTRSSMHQSLDDAYYGFVWSLVAQHPSVRVGVLPHGQTADVYVPPQPRVSKKGKNAQDSGQKEVPTYATLVPIPDYKQLSLEELTQLYGDRLRIAVDSEMCFVAVTGSHAKPAKLTPMVYAALQIIARSRDSGISVLELGKATGYDQKACFYIVKQLVELNLIVKLRRGGNSQNFCVHKYFFDRSPIWKSIREEEVRAQEGSTENAAVEDAAGDAAIGSSQMPHFDPIDTRHLTSLNILRQRLTKLLKCSPNGIQPYANISVKIGFLPRSRTDRRFFIVRLNELINEGIIEKFFMSSTSPETTHSKQLFLRLASSGRPPQISPENIAAIVDDDEMIDSLVTEDSTEQAQLKTDVTLHKQMIDSLQESSSTGATLNDLSDRLALFDKKTLELLIARMERQPPPRHLADLSVTQLLETHGRERRYRFFTLSGYSDLMVREGFELPSCPYSTEDLRNAGGSMEGRKNEFYNSRDELQTFYTKWAGTRVHRFRTSTKGATGRSSRVVEALSVQADSSPPRVASKKRTNPILPDGSRKRGRPPKNRDGGEERPPKKAKKAPGDETHENSIQVEDQAMDIEEVPSTPAKRKRGRPSKKKPDVTLSSGSADVVANVAAERDVENESEPTKVPPDMPTIQGGSVQQSQVSEEPNDDGTRVIASPVAQLNTSVSSDLPSNGGDDVVTVDPSLVDSAIHSTIPSTNDRDKALEEAHSSALEASRFTGGKEGMGAFSAPLKRTSSNASATSNREPAEHGEGSATTPFKRSQHSRRQHGRTNLSAIRRENELLRLIENAGGITNTSGAEFRDAYMDYIKTSVRAGEATSAPIGARTDRRTLNYTLDTLEERGQLKSISTNVPSITGVYRRARITYLPTFTEENVRDWLSRQKQPEHLPVSEEQASEKVVGTGMVSSHELIRRERVKKKRKETQKDLKKKEADMKVALAQKKLETVKSREAAWDAMVEKVHPGLVKGVAASRLRKLRQSYVQGSVLQDNHHWELQISDAIKAAEKMRSSRKLFPNVPQVSSRVAPKKQPEEKVSHLPISAQGKPVEDLVDLQKNLSVVQEEPEGSDSRKGKRKAGDRKGERIRRQRFQWNADYDELARDAYAILSARCRAHHRLEWSAVDQIFPSLPRGSIRARVSILKDQPGADAYLQRLENCWYELWVKKRGTPELPDPNPRNPNEFDLKAHLQYLREHVDKNAIRVGVSTIEATEFAPLAADPEDIFFSWNIEERKPAFTGWDFLSQFSIGEEAREKMLLESAFVMEVEELIDEEPRSDAELFTEAALKMVVGTPDESYNADEAAVLLHRIGDEAISAAMESLLSRNVLSKLVKDPTKLAPGRTVKISEMNQNALGGPIAKDIFVDASQLDESYEIATDEWREWPLTSTDGDTAALLQHFSDHRVEFEVNSSHARATRASIDGNSRKVDDDDIELSLLVKVHESGIPDSQPTSVEDEPAAMEVDDVSVSGHGTSVSGEQPSCGIRSGGVVDCLKCIEDARTQIDHWSDSDRNIAEFIIQQADSKGKPGISIEELKVLASIAEEAFTNTIHSLHTFHVPLIYPTGYSSSVAVSAKYADAYAVTLPVEDGRLLKVFPRRWLDISGDRVTLVWEAGLRAVVGLIHLRPGISQAELRWRLRTVYDRQEVLDLLDHLLCSGTLKIFQGGAWQSESGVCIHALTKEEEKAVFLAVREERRWYRVS